MSGSLAGFLQVGLLILALAACYKPLGDYIARVVTSEKDWRVERVVYRAIGVDSKADQRWTVYLRSMLAFSAISVLAVYLLERIQGHLFLSNGHVRRAAGRWPGTPRRRSPRTPTGRTTPARRRWVT